MADNVTLNPGVGGAVAATDDVGGVHYQKVKLDVGGDGLSVPVTGALPVSAAALPLPTGASTEATLAALNAKVTAVNTGAVVGTVTANAGTNLNTSALALESGGNLAAIKAKTDNIPALGQALAAASVPVILPAATITTLTPPAAITGFATAALQGGGLPAALGAGGGLKVDGSGTALPVSGTVDVTNAGITTIAGAVAGTEMQVDVVAALPAGTNAIGKLAANSGVDIGDVDVLSIAAGSNLIGDVAIGNRASGGATPYSYISDGTDFVSVTDGATTLYAISVTSIDATVVYIKFYDKATAPDPSADAASIKLRFAVPSAATGAGFVWNVPQGMDFPTGLGFALVTGAADTDETAVSANEVMVNLVYKH